jgi:hypothetical protein
MTVDDDLRSRLDRLAEAGARGVELARPDTAGARHPRGRRTAAVALAAIGVLAIVAAGSALVLRDDGGDAVLTAPGSPPTGDQGQAWEGEVAAVVAVVYGDGPNSDADVDLRFTSESGDVVADRNLRETAGTGGGLLQAIPEGPQQLTVTLRLEATERECVRPFRADIGEQVILRIEPPDDDASEQCAGREESVADWAAGHTGPTGQSYVGLTLAQAEETAREAGLTTRVVGLDGADLIVTLDLRTDRLNLMVFADVVVAARLDAE